MMELSGGTLKLTLEDLELKPTADLIVKGLNPTKSNYKNNPKRGRFGKSNNNNNRNKKRHN
jgi:hypothetical protein